MDENCFGDPQEKSNGKLSLLNLNPLPLWKKTTDMEALTEYKNIVE